MNGTLVLIAVSSRYTPSVRHREQAEKGLDRRGIWGRRAPRMLGIVTRAIFLTLLAMMISNLIVIDGGVEEGWL